MGRIDYVANCTLTMKVFDQKFAGRIADIWGNTRDDHDIPLDRKRELVNAVREYITYWSGRREALFPMTKEIGGAAKVILDGVEKALAPQLKPQGAMFAAIGGSPQKTGAHGGNSCDSGACPWQFPFAVGTSPIEEAVFFIRQKRLFFR